MRRALRYITFGGMLGAITTIGVAWACALFVTPRLGSNGPSYGWGYVWRDGWAWSYGANKAFGSIEIVWTPHRADDPARIGGTVVGGEAPSWSEQRTFSPVQTVDDTPYTVEFIEDGRGWPLIAMRSWRKVHRGGMVGNVSGAMQYIVLRPTVEQSGRAPVGGWLKTSPIDDRSLPLWPVWPGFVVNTALFGSLWLALLLAPRGVRRVVRRFRGRCPRCGYDLRRELAGGCSECGWRRGGTPSPSGRGPG